LFKATNTSGPAFYAQADLSSAIQAVSAYGITIQTDTEWGTPLVTRVANSHVEDVHSVVNLTRESSGTVVNGFGQSIDYNNEDDSGATTPCNQLISRWLDATHATRTSQFELWGMNSGSLSRNLTIAGSGKLILDAYTSSSAFTGTAVANLSVDVSGNVITVGGASGTFTSQDGKTITVTNGIITSIV
jgi:hypothetical protein